MAEVIIDARFVRDAKLIRTHLSRKPERGAILAGLLTWSAILLGYAFYNQDVAGIADLLPASPGLVFDRHEYWRLFTALFIHADLEHFLSNAFYLAGLAALLRGYFGWSAIFLSVLGGALANAFALATYPAGTWLLGASGVVYFMAAFWLALYFGIERGHTPIRRGVNAVGFATALLVPSAFEPHVSYRTHAFGFALGIVFGALYFLRNREKLRRSERFELPLEAHCLPEPEPSLSSAEVGD